MTSRLQSRLSQALEAREFYEAQQLYRTISFRLATKAEFDEASSVLYKGATALLQEKLFEGGGDLACQMVQIQAKNPQPPGELFVTRVGALCRLMKPGSAERESLTTRSLELLKPHDSVKQRLHREFGFTYWLEMNYSLSQYHFVRSSDSGHSCGLMLIEYSQLGYRSELDMFLTLTVLQLLCLRKLSPACLCFRAFTGRHPELRATPAPPFPPAHPLLNFTWLLLLSVRGNWPIACFQSLCQSYNVCLTKDPLCGQYLTKIGQMFFGLPKPREEAGPGGILGSLVRMLTGDEEASGGADDLLLDDLGASEADLRADDMD